MSSRMEPDEDDSVARNEHQPLVNGEHDNDSESSANSNHSNLYRVFSKESMQFFAEASGNANVDGDVLMMLSEDVVYRLRDVLQSSMLYIHHCQRNRLTCDDINRTLVSKDVPPVYGYGYNEGPLRELFVDEANVFCLDDQRVDINKSVDEILNKRCRQTLTAESDQYRIDWLTTEASMKKSLKSNHEQNDSSSSSFITHTASSSAPSPDTSALTSTITRAIVTDNEELFQTVKKNLSTISNVQHILPQLVRFISKSINNCSFTGDTRTSRQLLLTIQSLTQNSCVHIAAEPYMKLIVSSVLHCLLNHLNYDEWQSEHWNFREYSADILAQVVEEWNSSFIYNKLYNQVMRSLVETVSDAQRSFQSQYGAVCAFSRLGFEVILHHLYPHLKSLVDQIQLRISQAVDPLMVIAAQRTFNAIAIVGFLAIIKLKNRILNGDEHVNSVAIYSLFYDIFGDSIIVRVPAEVGDKRYREIIYGWKQKRHKDSDTKEINKMKYESGEQLLTVFYDACYSKSTVNGIGNCVTDESDDDEKMSNDSDHEPMKNDGTDLLIKSTISDPQLGIKLTIRKVRRAEARRSIDSDDRSVKRPKMDVKPIRIGDDRIFDDDWKMSNSPLTKYLIGQKMSMSNATESNWHLLSRRMTRTGKRPTIVNKWKTIENNWRRKMFSCSLLQIL